MKSLLPTSGLWPLLAYAQLTGRRLLLLIASKQPWRMIGRPFLWRIENQTVVGFATVYLDIVSVRFGQRAWVEDLAVAPQRRSSGIGKALLDATKTWARDHGAVWLGLESGAARVDAHRFYEREGPDGWSRSFRWTL